MTHFHPLDYLEVAAAKSPSAVALASPTQQLTYSEMFELVKQCAGKLRDHGIRPGDVVVTKLSPYWEWIFMQAIHHEAAIVCSGVGVPNDPPFEVSYLITDTSTNELQATNTIVISQEWIDLAKSAEALPDRIEYPADESTTTLMMTSGTTGTPKGAEFTVNDVYERMTYFNKYGTVDNQELCLMGLSTIGGYFFALNAAKNGFTYLAVNSISPETVQLANSYKIDHLIGASMQLDAYLDVLDNSGYSHPSISRITSAGAITPTALFERLKSAFNAEVVSIYGATETGGTVFKTIKFGDAPNDAGCPGYWVELEIVDDAGNKLAVDEVGKIRMRGIGVVNGYYKDAKATAEKFIDGWFYPGDLGSLDDAGHLYVGGREDEIINLGGLKFDPQIIDDFARLLPHVHDVAAAQVTINGGVPQLAVGIVPDENFSIQEFENALQAQFPDRSPTIYAEVNEIPRNQLRKVQRKILADLILKNLA